MEVRHSARQAPYRIPVFERRGRGMLETGCILRSACGVYSLVAHSAGESEIVCQGSLAFCTQAAFGVVE